MMVMNNDVESENNVVVENNKIIIILQKKNFISKWMGIFLETNEKLI